MTSNTPIPSIIDQEKIKVFYFSRDYIDEDKIEYREVKDEDGVIFTHRKKLIFTSWPLPQDGQKILYREYTKPNGEAEWREVFEDYWKEGEFRKHQVLELHYVADYFSHKTNTLHRVLVDDLGRKYSLDLQRSLETNNPKSGEIQNYVVRKINKNGYPFVQKGWTQGEFEIDQKVNLELIEEQDKKELIYEEGLVIDEKVKLLRILKDREDRTYVVSRLPFQTGIKYIPKNPGDIIEYKVDHIFDDNSPHFTQTNPINKYFINKSDLSTEARKYFNKLNNTGVKGEFLNIDQQYENHDGNWIWTFLTLLDTEHRDALKNNNILELKNILPIGYEVCNVILKSGFLLSLREDKRKEQKIRLEKDKKKIDSMKFLIEKVVESENRNKDIDILLGQPISSQDEQDENKVDLNLYQLLRHFDYYISNSLIEQLLEKSNESLHIDVRSSLSRTLWTRKKRIRSDIFEEEVDNPTKKISLKDNPELKHLIVLTKHELSVANNKAEIMILEATILRYEAYLLDSVEKINECLELLEKRIKINDFIPDEDLRNIWFRDYNFNIVQCHHFLAKHATNLTDTIKHYQISSKFYSKLGAKQSYVDSGLVRYFQLASLIENGESLQLIATTCKKEYKYYNMPDKRNLTEEILFLTQLKDMFEILSLIGNSSKNNEKLLLDFSHKYSEESGISDKLYNSKIASLVLMDMLSDNENKELLEEKLSVVFEKGVLELKDYSSTVIDINSDEYLENQLINAISKDEKQTLEHKGSWGLDIDKYIAKEPHNGTEYKQENEVVKGVAGMLNANYGGKLYIGVLEKMTKYRKEGEKNALIERLGAIELDGDKNLLIGVDKELKLRGWNSDNLMQIITKKLEKDIDEAVAKHFSVESKTAKDKTIIEITIHKDSYNKFGWWINNDEELPVRQNNYIKILRGGKARKWLDDKAEQIQKAQIDIDSDEMVSQ